MRSAQRRGPPRPAPLHALSFPRCTWGRGSEPRASERSQGGWPLSAITPGSFWQPPILPNPLRQRTGGLRHLHAGALSTGVLAPWRDTGGQERGTREQVAGRLLSGSASLEEAPRSTRVGYLEPGAHPSLTAGVPPSTPHCTLGGGHWTPDHTDWRDAATQGHTQMSASAAGLYPLPDSGQWEGRQGTAEGVVWAAPRLAGPAWQGGRWQGGVFWVQERASASREQQYLGPTQAAVRSNRALEAPRRGWTPSHHPPVLQPCNRVAGRARPDS